MTDARETALRCLQHQDLLTHSSFSGVSSAVLPRWGGGFALLNVAAVSGEGAWTAFPLLWPQGQFSHQPKVLMGMGGGHLFTTHATTRQMSNRNSSPTLTTLGMLYPHLHQQVGSIFLPTWGVGPDLLSVAAGSPQLFWSIRDFFTPVSDFQIFIANRTIYTNIRILHFRQYLCIFFTHKNVVYLYSMSSVSKDKCF